MTKRKRISKIVNGMLLVICILSAAAALLLGGETVKEGWEYDSLAKDAELRRQTESTGPCSAAAIRISRLGSGSREQLSTFPS